MGRELKIGVFPFSANGLTLSALHGRDFISDKQLFFKQLRWLYRQSTSFTNRLRIRPWPFHLHLPISLAKTILELLTYILCHLKNGLRSRRGNHSAIMV